MTNKSGCLISAQMCEKGMKKYAIYTACIGGYDNILQPEIIDERFDYILFTDDVKVDRIGVWQVRKIGYYNSNTIRIARYVKTHPEELLNDYHATLWLDANIQIVSSQVYERIYELYSQGIEIASVTHPTRDCVYDEAYELMRMKWEHDYVLFRWCSKMIREGFPPHYGMYETNILYRRNTAKMKEFDELWWNCISKNSYRDQMSCTYSLWKCDIDRYYFLPQGESVWNTSVFRYIWHPDASFKKKSVNLYRFENIRWRIRHELKEDKDLYKKIYFRLYRYPFSPLMLYVREMVDLFWLVLYKLQKRNK